MKRRNEENNNPTMKKTFRKLHLWFSVPFGVIITLICFSGAMLVFEQELTEWTRPQLYRVQQTGTAPLPAHEIVEKAAATLPANVTVTGITFSADPSRTWQVNLSQPRRAALFVDPYTGEIKGRNERPAFFTFMLRVCTAGCSTAARPTAVRSLAARW